MSSDPADPYIGRLVAEKFRVESRLGVGSVGTVYRATHVQLNRPVALKVLRASLALEPSHVERFTREARLASQLDHPNVVHVYDYGTDASGLTYLAMELAEGKDLAAVIDHESPLASERIVALLVQVLGALVAAHRLGIVHRDLKPENILVVSRPADDGRDVEVTKVADFGIARVYGEAARGSEAITRFGSANGTPEYMSPEQALAEELDGRSDVYACGVILYEMLAGQPPFVGDSPLEIVEHHVRDKPTPPSQRRAGVDPRLEAVAMRALEKRREDRYADAAGMRAALLAALAQPLPAEAPSRPRAEPSVMIEVGPSELVAPEEVRAPESRDARAADAARPTTPHEPERVRPNRVPWIAVAAIAIALAATGAWWLAHRSGDTGAGDRAGPADAGVAQPVVTPSSNDAGAQDLPALRRRRGPAGRRGGAPSTSGH